MPANSAHSFGEAMQTVSGRLTLAPAILSNVILVFGYFLGYLQKIHKDAADPNGNCMGEYSLDSGFDAKAYRFLGCTTRSSLWRVQSYFGRGF